MNLSSRPITVLVVAAMLLASACQARGGERPTTNAPSMAAESGAPSPHMSSEAPTAIAPQPGEPWILYSWWLPGDPEREIFLVRADGAYPHAILSDVPGEHASPSWSSDGAHFAFGVAPNSLWVADADGGNASLLTDGGGACPDGLAHPSWSPDGSTIAFICYPDPGGKQGSVALFELATGRVTRLMTVDWPEHLDGAPTWSPDGRSLAVAILHWEPTDTLIDGSLISVVDVRTKAERRITTFKTNMSGPAWRPDGSELVMFSFDVGNMHTTVHPSNLYLIKPDGSHQRQITDASVDGNRRIVQPSWSPDGSRIMCVVATSTASNYTVDELELSYVDPAGGEPVLFTPTILGSEPVLRPTS